MSTNVLSAKDIKREKHTIDASGKILGRLAGEIATLLMGKNKQSLPFPNGKGKPNHWVPYLDTGDYVVVINASKVKVTGKKATDKVYARHSGYPGGLKVETFDKMLIRKPEFIIEHAVKGMLPGNKLGKAMIKKLKVFKGPAEGEVK